LIVRLIFLYCLWAAPRSLQLAILIALARKKFFSQFPIFTAYTAYSICDFVALFFINRSPSLRDEYFRWYTYDLGVSAALRFGIICEVFTHVFQNHAAALRHLQRPIFRLTTVALLTLALCLAVYTQRNSDLRWFVVHVLDRSASVVQGGLMLFLFAFAFYMNISWRKPVFGIALGLGIYLSIELAVAAIRSQAGDVWPVGLDLLTMGAYFSCVIVWLFCLLTPERSPADISDTVSETDLDLWNNELDQLLHQ
jgi:hypothetical protein